MPARAAKAGLLRLAAPVASGGEDFVGLTGAAEKELFLEVATGATRIPDEDPGMTTALLAGGMEAEDTPTGDTGAVDNTTFVLPGTDDAGGCGTTVGDTAAGLDDTGAGDCGTTVGDTGADVGDTGAGDCGTTVGGTGADVVDTSARTGAVDAVDDTTMVVSGQTGHG
ncbi:MAG: hypothetical protein M1812_002386 [Candelaria pacifica]|nr:MAG: hypothetical protein M1812_002386 [Candelaria pacifica]